ncbi:MAG: peptidylprolyl isomerase [Alphaproteobacteria bacterium]|nr:peptidylprolyl isomerase [Alphaproteobacteria bacterium]
MSSKTTKTLPIIIVAIIAIAAGGYYFMQKKGDTADMAGAELAAQSAQAPESDNAEASSASVETAAGTEEASPAPAPITADQLTVVPGNPVVARVDGKDITRVDVYRFIQTMPANIQQLPATTVYPMAMEQVINTRIVQNKADAADVTESEAFAKEMEIAKQQIARNLYLQETVDKEVTDSKLKKLYNDLMAKTPDVEERRASHILLETEDQAKAVIEKLAKGGDFEGMAKELSKDPTAAARGGDLGYFAKTDMVPEFANAAFGMQKGDVSQSPVKTQFGWHVIKMVDVRQRPKPTFDQIKPSLQAELRREELNNLLEKWRKDAKIEQFDINGNPLKEGANATGLVPPATETN